MDKRGEDAFTGTVHSWLIDRGRISSGLHAYAQGSKFYVGQFQESDFRLSAADAGM